MKARKTKTLIVLILGAGVTVVSIFVFARGNPNVAKNSASETSNVMVPTVGTTVGSLAPLFTIQDVITEKIITNADLKRKPAIVWFTTTYCVPCQIGAQEVEKLDDDLGGSAFNVVMVFIDPEETKMDLQLWKAQFANDDWVVAFGVEEIVKEYRIRFLDTQYLLNKNGIIENIANTTVGYEAYRKLLQPLL